MKIKTSMIAVVMAGLLTFTVFVSPSAAKGPPAKVLIEGPGISSALEITDEATLMAFSLFQFEDVEHPVSEPENPGPGFMITRLVKVSNGETPWDRLTYYPLGGEKAGVVFLEGIIGPDQSGLDSQWYQVSHTGDAAMHEILNAAGVTLIKENPMKTDNTAVGAADPAGKVNTGSAKTAELAGKGLMDPPATYPLALGVGVLGIGVLLLFLVRRRRIRVD